MSPRLFRCAIVRLDSVATLVRPFLYVALLLGLLAADAAVQAQSAESTFGWQAAPESASPVPSGVPRPKAETHPTRASNANRHAASEVTQAIAEESVFEDVPRAKPARSLAWQSQTSAPVSVKGARRYPAETRPDAATANPNPIHDRQVVRTAYEFDDAPGDARHASSGPNAEPIPTPKPIRTTGPTQTNSGPIYDDPSEIISDEGDGEMLGDACGCCEDCGHCSCIRCCRPFAGKLWVRGEYLLWWSPGYGVPALVTTSTDTTYRSGVTGAVGQNGTSILFGNSQLSGETRSGLRIGAGYLLMPCRDTSIEGYYTTTGTLSTQFFSNASVLARPYVSTVTGTQGADLISFSNLATGSIAIQANSEFNSAEALIRRKMRDGDNYHIDFLLGYRYARLAEDLSIIETQNVQSSGLRFPFGNTVSITDTFAALNEFHGGQFGFSFSEQFNRWTLDVTTKLAVGNTRTQMFLAGDSRYGTTSGTSSLTTSYPDHGVLVQPSNVGPHNTNGVTVIPEFGVKLGFFVNRRLKLSAGYNFMYWSKIMRPGDQIDINMNPSQLPPGPTTGMGLPQYMNRTTDFWMQGVTAGLEYRF
jgi:hypothetical protein